MDSPPTRFLVQDAKPTGPGGQWRRRRLVRLSDLTGTGDDEPDIPFYAEALARIALDPGAISVGFAVSSATVGGSPS
jgi:hypothetical protein